LVDGQSGSDDGRSTFIYLIGITLIILWVVSLKAYSELPSRIPVHFNWDGTPNRWDDKTVLHFFLLPGIASLISTFMLIISQYPQLYNFPQKEEVKTWPEEYKIPVYAVLNRMMYWVGFLIALMFLFIQIQIIQGAKSQSFQPANLWPMWILVAVITLLPIYYLVTLSRLVKETRRKRAQKS
jgi:uncharacterized membrane protein